MQFSFMAKTQFFNYRLFIIWDVPNSGLYYQVMHIFVRLKQYLASLALYLIFGPMLFCSHHKITFE